MYKCFDYKCEDCGKIFEDLSESNKVEPTRCIYCDSLNVKRQFPMPTKVTIPGSNQIGS
jgi:putative FmdB family regulatory protein